MNSWVYGVVLVVCGVTAVLLVVDLVRDRAAQDSHFLALAVTEVVVLVQAVWGFVALARTDRDVEGVTLVSYLVTMVLLPVVGAFFSLTERTRVGTSILLLAVATIAAMELRVADIWG
ncbi:MAG TPA: hypothetical protein VNS55_02210, partial [Nocardioides sp.]|nr:hypothetical protein [Nocardioides sp.]